MFVAANTTSALAINNIFAGKGTVSEGPVTLRRNLVVERAQLMDAARYDYRVKPGSLAVGVGDDPGEGDGFNLRPQFEYVHPMGGRPRAAKATPDTGAYGVGDGSKR